jgi:hypothetical protein
LPNGNRRERADHLVARLITQPNPHAPGGASWPQNNSVLAPGLLKNGKAEIHAANAEGITAMALAGDKMMVFYANRRQPWRAAVYDPDRRDERSQRRHEW